MPGVRGDGTMTVFHDDGQAVFHLGDCREVLREMPVEGVGS